MYKVLIADDEDIIRNGLVSMVSQHSQLEVVAAAEDGEIALEMAMESKPDLMLVDINMPFLNGLEFIERTLKVLPDVMIVIVTGYDDFAFAQKALKLGAVDYILKPIMEEPFFAMLDKAVARLSSMDKSRRFLNWIEHQLEQNRPALINEFVRNWLAGRLDEVELEERMHYLRIHLPDTYMVSILHLYKDYEREMAPRSADREDILYFGCQNIVQELFSPFCEPVFFRTEDGALAMITERLTGQQWEKLTEKLKASISECLRAKVELEQQQGSGTDGFPEAFELAMERHKARQHYSDPVKRAMSIVHQEFGDSDLSLQSVADKLYVSPQYLSRIFHRDTGENFGAYLTRKRINEAIGLLHNPDIKMYEIAQKTGYTTQHYFSSAFKKAMGISPVEYRRNIFGREGEK